MMSQKGKELKNILLDTLIQEIFTKIDVIQDIYQLINNANTINKQLTYKLLNSFITQNDSLISPNSNEDWMPQSLIYKIYNSLENIEPNNDFNNFIKDGLNNWIKIFSDTVSYLKAPISNFRVLKMDVDEFIVNIMKKFESLRYIFGLFLGLFDIIENNTIETIESYFSKDHNVYNGLYGGKRKIYGLNKHKFKKSPRPTLKEYLEKYHEYNNLKEYLEFIVDTLKPIRNHAAHHLGDITQDKILEGIYKIFDKENKYREIQIIDLFMLGYEISLFLQNTSVFILLMYLYLS
ncbi:MAG: hypothetical protein ACTSU2_17340 [Promethearchaeota archaeon]